eukprot:Tbor_TRINITY_DN4038_c0_g1::TRINITY_DN4038_c0_g1_i1::g.11816::m.11816/K09553/STIP1; stress-induced-phosphoprotein 1
MDAAAYKAKGNDAFSAKNFEEAIEHFSSAIDLDPSNHVLYSNRSASYASLKNYKSALEDAKKCVDLNKTWAKGYIRLGSAYHGLKQYDEAIKAYETGKDAAPDSSSLFDDAIEDVRKDSRPFQRQDPFGKVFGPDCVQKIHANPKIAPYMMQPDFVQIISKIVADSSQVQLFLKDKRVMHCFMELSGISMPGGMDDDDDDVPVPPPKKEAPKKPEEKKPVGDPEALKLKNEGNELYKNRQFDEALEKYQAAVAMEPTNTTYLLNITAVYFEKEEYDTCIAECDKALEHAMENKADYTIVGKLLTRKAFSLQKQKKYTEAIQIYKKALVEHRNADTLNKLTACEKIKKQADEEAYLDPEIAIQKKEEGNAYFKKDEFPKAVECYTEAIKRNPKEHTTYSNRAAAYIKLGAHNEGLADCEKCLDIKPDFVKAHARKGHCYFWTKQYNKAIKAYDDGLKIDPANVECKEGKMRTQMKIQEMATGDGDQDAAQRAMSDPEIQGIMGDTYMQMILGEMQRDPSRIGEYMTDPTIAEKIRKLIAAGIIRMGSGAPGGR